MTSLPTYLRPDGSDFLLAVKVQPRAAADAIVGPLGGELRVRVTAPPVDAAANAALVRFLADQFGCARRQVELVRGHASRHKVLRLRGVPAEAILARLPGGGPAG
jgi:hypothetical protein